MRASITQESDYGCGIACYAFALGISYPQAAQQLGQQQAQSDRFWVRDLTTALNRAGKTYQSKHVRLHAQPISYEEGTIVLVRRSEDYPAGHYLIRHNGCWMDPWINLPTDRNISHATSGFREQLPGVAMYVIYPT